MIHCWTITRAKDYPGLSTGRLIRTARTYVIGATNSSGQGGLISFARRPVIKGTGPGYYDKRDNKVPFGHSAGEPLQDRLLQQTSTI